MSEKVCKWHKKIPEFTEEENETRLFFAPLACVALSKIWGGGGLYGIEMTLCARKDIKRWQIYHF